MRKHKVSVGANGNSEKTWRYPLKLYINGDNECIHKFIHVAQAQEINGDIQAPIKMKS